MGRRPTLADVARAAGVSSTAASLVLSGRAREMRISTDVEDRVHRAAGELGYRRNIVSVGLRTGRTRTLGFVSDTVATSQLAGNMIRGALERARERGHMLLIGESGDSPEEERRLLEAMADRQVDGLVLASMYTRRRTLPGGLGSSPLVLLNALAVGPGQDPGPAAHPDLPTVLPDEEAGGRAAAGLLLEAGHRDGIHLLGTGLTEAEVPNDSVAGAARLRGILAATAAAGTTPRSGTPLGVWQPPDGFEATRRLLADAGPGAVRALVCMNDHVAMGAYQALAGAGLRVPDDVSVVAFDDVPLAAWLRPALTTVALPHHELGRAAVDLLCDAVEGDGASRTPATLALPMPVRRRESVAPPG